MKTHYFKLLVIGYSMQSSVTLYIPFDGIIKQLMHEEGAVAAKGEPLVMIEVDSTTEEEGEICHILRIKC